MTSQDVGQLSRTHMRRCGVSKFRYGFGRRDRCGSNVKGRFLPPLECKSKAKRSSSEVEKARGHLRNPAGDFGAGRKILCLFPKKHDSDQYLLKLSSLEIVWMGRVIAITPETQP